MAVAAKHELQFPPLFTDDNLLWTYDLTSSFNIFKKACWAGYEIKGFSYDHLGKDGKLRLLRRLTQLFSALDMEYHLLSIPEYIDPGESLRNLATKVKGPVAPFSRELYSRTADYVSENTGPEACRYRTFLLVKLRLGRGLIQDGKTFAKSLVAEPNRIVKEVAGWELPSVLEYEINEARNRAKTMKNRIEQAGVPCLSIKEKELVWLYRRSWWRGIANPTFSQSKLRPIRFGKYYQAAHNRMILSEGPMDITNPHWLKTSQLTATGVETGYSTFGTLATTPDEGFFFPGQEWLYSAQRDLPFPVEIHVRVSPKGYKQTSSEVEKKRMDIDDQIDNINEGNSDVPYELQEKREKTLQVEMDLTKRRNLTLETSVIIVVAARNEEELKSRIEMVKDHYSHLNSDFEVPAGDQFNLFNECLPGGARVVKDYIHRFPPETLAGAMLGAADLLGDYQGPYIGFTGIRGTPVQHNPARAPQLNMSASMSFSGGLGGGKSLTANLFTYHTVMLGGQGLVFDPKNDRTLWPELLPGLNNGGCQVITLGKDNAGMLDPYVILRNRPEQAGDLCSSIFSFLGKIEMGSDEFACLSEAIKKIKHVKHPSSSKVVEALEVSNDVDAKRLARRINAYRDLSLTRLLFGEGTEQTISLDLPLTVLQIQNLNLPDKETAVSDYSLEEYISVALMMGNCAFAENFIFQSRDIFRSVLMDEFWSIIATKYGKKLAWQLIRAGRAMNNGVNVVTQGVKEMKDFANYFEAKFVFPSKDRDEILATLDYLGMEKTEQNINLIMNLQQGQDEENYIGPKNALFQDIHKRVGVVAIDTVFNELLTAFNTKPPSMVS